jgi:hypothetical protein
MFKARSAVSVGLILALCAMAGPRMTHADAVATSGCASGAATTTISTLSMTFTGRTTNAMPMPPVPFVPPAISIVGTENLPIVLPAPPAAVTTVISGTAEYGLFNYISGIKPVAIPNAENEISEFFTFATTVTTVTDTVAGAFLSSARTGTFTVYLGHGDFSNVATFSRGTPIMTASFSQHILVPNPAVLITPPTVRFGSVALAVVGGTVSTTTSAPATAQLSLPTGPMFTSTATATVTSASPFTYGGTCYQLGTTGKTLTLTSVGQFDSPTAVSGNLNGAISG